uniref:Glutamine amidotransferase type-2 domain-containing protein n=1 Tax=viral metagenome TaxID=1070528 RepID=A0A6M3XTY1_9ZZZZ
MCLAIYKPTRSKLPTKEELEEAFRVNSDGFGLAVRVKDKGVVILKGAMTRDDMFALLKKVEEHADTRRSPMLLHFRHATEGRVWAGNCHPFPVTSNPKDLQAVSIVTDMALVHNGVITHLDNKECEPVKPTARPAGTGTRPLLPVPYRGRQFYDDDYGWYGGEGAPVNAIGQSNYYRSGLELKFTDTQVFIRDFLAPLKPVLMTKPFIRMIVNWVGSKFAILTQDNFWLLGDFHEHAGCWFSNKSYVKTITTTYTRTEPPMMNRPASSGIYLKCDLCLQFKLKSEVEDMDDNRVCSVCRRALGAESPTKSEDTKEETPAPAGGETAKV